MNKEDFIRICENSKSMRDAAVKVGLKTNKFYKIAKEYGCYKPNQSGKGINKPQSTRLETEDILNGKHPQYQTCHLKDRLLKENYKINTCEICGISEWNGKLLNMQLHHKDGNCRNHTLSNLEIICPNCHAQTDSFCGKNKK